MWNEGGLYFSPSRGLKTSQTFLRTTLNVPMAAKHKKVFGIDFGTTETAIFCYVNGTVQLVRQADGNELLSSVVAFQNGKPIVGTAAKDVEGQYYAQLKRIRGRK